MAINLRSPSAETREQRLGTITSWDGPASRLAHESAFSRGDCGPGCGGKGQRICELESPFSQGSTCSEQIAESQASNVRDAVLVQHSPIGCAAGHINSNAFFRNGLMRRGLAPRNVTGLSSNLIERDMIYGGAEKLRATIKAAVERHQPKAVFVATSCATGIIGDDVESVVRDCEDELGVPVVAMYCEGFKSKHWSSGFDAIQHGVLRHVVKPKPGPRQDNLVNIIVLWGSDVFTPMLAELGLEANNILTVASVDEIARASEAAASVTFCYSVGGYLGAALEQQYGVQEIKAPQPYGFAGTDAWLRALAKATHREELAEAYIAREHARVRPQIERLRERLKGVRGYVAMGAAYAHGVIGVLRELGVEVPGSLVFHHDPVYDSHDVRQDSLGHMIDAYGDVEHFSISNRQPYQFYNLLKRSDPDFIIIRHGGLAGLASRLGVPAIALGDASTAIGYQGMIDLGEEIVDALAQRKFHQDLAGHTSLPYKQWWLDQADPYLLARQNAPQAAGSRV